MKRNVGAGVLAALLACAGCGSTQPGSGDGTTSPQPRPTATAAWVPPPGCPPVPSTFRPSGIDYVDFVRWNGVRYYSSLPGEQAEPGQPLPEASVGPEVFRIACELSAYNDKTYADPGSDIDKSAGHVDVGTPVHAVRGFPTECRITAKVEGAWRLYRASVADAPTLTEAPCPALAA